MDERLLLLLAGCSPIDGPGMDERLLLLAGCMTSPALRFKTPLAKRRRLTRRRSARTPRASCTSTRNANASKPR